MTPLQAILLGVVQGATEFIPVSSSGHLVLVPWLLGWDSPSLVFDVAVHCGTLLAVLIYFRRDWLKMVRSTSHWLRKRRGNESSVRLLGLIIIGTLPAAVVGILFQNFFEHAFAQPLVVTLMLLVTAAMLLVGEHAGKSIRGMEHLTWRDSLLIGLAQALAIMPGISRSGSTIAASRLLDTKRGDAARFSFLLSMPVIVAASVLQLVEVVRGSINTSEAGLLLCGFASAFLSGYIVIRGLLGFLHKHSTDVFSAYCVVLAIASFVALVVRAT